jgi:hypothetical protein
MYNDIDDQPFNSDSDRPELDLGATLARRTSRRIPPQELNLRSHAEVRRHTVDVARGEPAERRVGSHERVLDEREARSVGANVESDIVVTLRRDVGRGRGAFVRRIVHEVEGVRVLTENELLVGVREVCTTSVHVLEEDSDGNSLPAGASVLLLVRTTAF